MSVMASGRVASRRPPLRFRSQWRPAGRAIRDRGFWRWKHSPSDPVAAKAAAVQAPEHVDDDVVIVQMVERKVVLPQPLLKGAVGLVQRYGRHDFYKVILSRHCAHLKHLPQILRRLPQGVLPILRRR